MLPRKVFEHNDLEALISPEAEVGATSWAARFRQARGLHLAVVSLLALALAVCTGVDFVFGDSSGGRKTGRADERAVPREEGRITCTGLSVDSAMGGACHTLGRFTDLWDTSEPAAMQRGVDLFTSADVQLHFALDSSDYLDIYRDNLGRRMQKYMVNDGLFTWRMEPAYVCGTMETGVSEVTCSRKGKITVQGLSWLYTKALSFILKPGDFPTSRVNYLEECTDCRASFTVRLVRDPGAASDWKIVDLTIVKLD